MRYNVLQGPETSIYVSRLKFCHVQQRQKFSAVPLPHSAIASHSIQTNMAAKISNKVVVVTGGSRGIGLEWVRQLLQQDNMVIATARDPESAAGLTELGQRYGSKLHAARLDTSSAGSIVQWAEEVKRKVSHVDVLINNAGASNESFEQGIADITPNSLSDAMTVNAFGPILVTQELMKQGLLGGESPSLCVYTSSIMASMGGFAFPVAKMYAYRASKAALNMLVVTSVEELTPRNITSVMMHPGYVATDMTANLSIVEMVPGFPGTISTIDSITGQLKVLEHGRPLNGKFYSYTGDNNNNMLLFMP